MVRARRRHIIEIKITRTARGTIKNLADRPTSPFSAMVGRGVGPVFILAVPDFAGSKSYPSSSTLNNSPPTPQFHNLAARQGIPTFLTDTLRRILLVRTPAPCPPLLIYAIESSEVAVTFHPSSHLFVEVIRNVQGQLHPQGPRAISPSQTSSTR